MSVTRFDYTGAVQTFQTPAGVTSVIAECFGASTCQGVDADGNPVAWESGGYVKGTFAWAAGTLLRLYVGGGQAIPSSASDANPGGWNGGGAGSGSNSNFGVGGGGGGGATDIRVGGTALASRVIVAGGAGGYAQTGIVPNQAGAGGGATGAAGWDDSNVPPAPPAAGGPWSGKGGTASAGGAGGTGAHPGGAGALGQGGNAPTGNTGGGAPRSYQAGGGGGGYYGGGGGADVGLSSGTSAGSGGGGSGFITGATSTTNTQGGLTSSALNKPHGYILLTMILPPAAPNPVFPFNNTNVDSTASITFQWTNPPLPEPGDTLTAYEIQYRNVGATGWTSLGKVTSTATSATIAAGTFTPLAKVEWQVRSYGTLNPNPGGWSASYFFTAITPPPAPTIITPAAGSTIASSPQTVTWSPVSGQQAFEVRRTDGSTTTYYDSGVDNDEGSSLVIPFDTASRTEHVQVRVMVNGLWSPYADNSVTVAIVPPSTPTIAAAANSAAASITVTVTNPITARTNLCPNPSFETSTGSWTTDQTGATLTRDTTTAYVGAASLKVVGNPASTSGYKQNCYVLPIAFSVPAGTALRWTIAMKGNAGGEQITIGPVLNSSRLAAPITQTVTLTTAWQVFTIDVIAPTAVTNAYLILSDTLDSSAVTFWVDAVGILTDQNGGYFDGNTTDTPSTNYAWTSTVNNSASTATNIVAVDHNDIYRSDPQNTEIRVATGLPPNSSWTDTTPASGVLYSYRAVAVAATGAGASS